MKTHLLTTTAAQLDQIQRKQNEHIIVLNKLAAENIL